MSEKETQISKLKHRQEELLKELNDNFSTKSIDELNGVRRELHRLEGRWTRRCWISLFH